MLRRLPSPAPDDVRPLPAGAPGGAAGWRAAPRWFALGLIGLAVGIGLGLALTRAALRQDPGFGTVAIGPWRVSPTIGTPDIDPYRRARLAETGEVPMARGQGLTLSARVDDAGHKLERTCAYRVTGDIPKARFWTLGLVDQDGAVIANPAERFSFTSADVLRGTDDRISIAVAPDVQPGNWLPLSGRGRFTVVLRLYDPAAAALGDRSLRSLAVPALVAERCP